MLTWSVKRNYMRRVQFCILLVVMEDKNTKKFHYPDCGSVKQMSEHNKDYMTCTRDDAIARGYVGCKNCNP